MAGNQSVPSGPPAIATVAPSLHAAVVSREMPFESRAIPIFKGKNTGTWLDKYNLVAKTVNATPEGKVNGLIWYLSDDEPDILSFVKTLPCWQQKDWDAIESELRRAFPDMEEDSRYNAEDLRRFINKPRAVGTVADLSDYYVDFQKVGGWLMMKGEITEREHARFFYMGLPQTIRDALELQALASGKQAIQSGTTGPKPYPKLDEIYEKVQILFKRDEFYAHENRMRNRELQTIAKYPPIAVQAPIAERPPPGVRPVVADPNIDTLTRQLEEMKIQLATLVNTTSNGNTPSYPTGRYSPRGSVSFATGANAMPIGDRKCPYDGCDKTKRNCDALTADIRSGIVKLEDGTSHILYPDGTKVAFIAGAMRKQVQDRAAAAANQNKPIVAVNAVEMITDWPAPAVSSIPRAFVHSLTAEQLEVLAAEKRAMDDQERNDREPAPKKRTGNRYWEDVLGGTPDVVHDAIMQVDPNEPHTGKADTAEPQTKSKRSDAPKRMPGSRMWAPVEESVNLDELAAQILSEPIPIEIGRLLGLSPGLAKLIETKSHRKRVPVPTTTPYVRKPAVPADNDRSAQTATIEEINHVEVGLVSNQKPTYSYPLVRIPLEIAGRPFTGLIDGGAEISLMPYSFWEKTGLPLRDDVHIGFKGINGFSHALECVENVPVHVGNLTFNLHFFVCEDDRRDVLLGLPPHRDMKVATWFDDADHPWVRFTDKEGRTGKCKGTTVAHTAVAVQPDIVAAREQFGDGECKSFYAHTLELMHSPFPETLARTPINILLAESVTDIDICTDTVEVIEICDANDAWMFDLIPQLDIHPTLSVNTLYKSKAKKTRPLDIPLPSKYAREWKHPKMDRDPYDTPINLAFFEAPFEPGVRLTLDRIEQINWGPWLAKLRRKALIPPRFAAPRERPLSSSSFLVVSLFFLEMGVDVVVWYDQLISLAE